MNNIFARRISAYFIYSDLHGLFAAIIRRAVKKLLDFLFSDGFLYEFFVFISIVFSNVSHYRTIMEFLLYLVSFCPPKSIID